jgi:glycosyltransferase involved in cell wall biosynthesis
MACGRPAVVFAEGGAAEAIIEAETGLLFRSPTPQALRAAVDALDATRFNTAALRDHAEGYSRAAFDARMRGLLASAMKRHQEQTAAC